MKTYLTPIFQRALRAAFGDALPEYDPNIQTAARAEYGDYQANFAMKLAKILQKKPMDVANAVLAQLEQKEIFAKLEPSGPGFINITLSNEFLAQHVQSLNNNERLGIEKLVHPETIVVEYSSPNVAKEMHVGHLRTTIIGDAIARILNFLGHHVIRQNHVGDWGTQFGMLIEYMLEKQALGHAHTITELNQLYKQSKQRFDEDTHFADKARQRVVALQGGDKKTLEIWQTLVNESKQYFQEIYSKLGVLLTDGDVRGESSYNAMLAPIVQELEKNKIVELSEGALVIFLEGFVDPDNKPLPMIIRKQDGGYLYATTDLAAVKFRIEHLHAQRIIYITDARQRQHFAMVFAAAKRAGWCNDKIKLEHLPYGAVLGEDNRPFKTRSGETISLISLIAEAEERAAVLAKNKNPDLTSEQIKTISKAVGIGALKYADLRADKVKDYVFSWDKMLSFEGNTAPYLQNAYVRIRSVFRNGKVDLSAIKAEKIIINDPVEHLLAVKLLEFSDIIYSVSQDLALHRLCEYLYDIAATFHKFYENCPILSAPDQSLRNSRLLLSDLTARTLKLGLSLLGIEVIEQM